MLHSNQNFFQVKEVWPHCSWDNNNPSMLQQVRSTSRNMAFSWRLGWWIDDDPISQLVFNKCFNESALRFRTWPVPMSYHQSGERRGPRTQNWAHLYAKECDRCLSTFGSSHHWHHQNKTKMEEQSQSLLWIREIPVNIRYAAEELRWNNRRQP